MEISMINGAGRSSEKASSDAVVTVANSVSKLEPIEVNMSARVDQVSRQNSMDQEEQKGNVFEVKDPTVNSIDSTFSKANSKLAKTRCEYSYDEDTKRVSIKVFDKDSDELIREVPPEKSLEMLQKMWELAGIMVDEKR